MKPAVDNESNSSDSPPPASPYSRRHPRRKPRKNKIAAKQIESNSIIVNRIAPPVPVDAIVAYQRHDEIVKLPDYVEFEQPKTVYGQQQQQRRLDAASTAADSVVFNFDSAESSPYSRRYPASASRKMRYT